MDSVDKDVEKILNGEGLEVQDFDSTPGQAQAVTLRTNVCYIVSAVIFNTEGEVLMVQEAKKGCYGQWYLPAGRMEVGESIHEALRREVREEAGVECEPVTMLMVQEQGQQWIRFTFLAEVTGGSLKTSSEADSESLQAQWWDREASLPLRSRDIVSLIDAGLRYRQKPWFPVCHPVDLPCSVVCQRLLVVFMSAQRMWLLLAKHSPDPGTDPGTHAHLPVTVSEKGCLRHVSVTSATHRLVQECMQEASQVLDVSMRGILGVQHNGRVPGQTDGICFNMLVTLDSAEEGEELSSPPLLDGERFAWRKVTNQTLKDKILKRITDKSVLPMHSL